MVLHPSPTVLHPPKLNRVAAIKLVADTYGDFFFLREDRKNEVSPNEGEMLEYLFVSMERSIERRLQMHRASD